jgi:glycine betaine catabolism B
MIAVEVNGEKVCLSNVNGKYYAIGNVCTHMGGPLAEGKLEEYIVQCPVPGLILGVAKWLCPLQ